MGCPSGLNMPMGMPWYSMLKRRRPVQGCQPNFGRAGVYIAEEVALIMREKLIHLQFLCTDQFKRLQHLLKEKKQCYLHNYKAEQEALGSSLSGESSGQRRREVKASKMSSVVWSALWNESLMTQAS
ncbi:hypothetical protein Celaphus_00012940 [Cervus elaphus hippelaphus]|uniref:Uncharacterized protein n=1 Tax=Cervus elaphus hippelaphus TaxID=46360 RepID=A0A212CI10_CEREH|nr:hypothetical protein Celaphus_00012940 [Cervus elaphus hippelaphus]